MLEGQGMILKCGMEIRLGWVSRVPGLRKKAKIREAKLPHKLFHGRSAIRFEAGRSARTNQQKQTGDQSERYRESEIKNRFSHR
jgi:hypothetical protein